MEDSIVEDFICSAVDGLHILVDSGQTFKLKIGAATILLGIVLGKHIE